MVTCITCGCKKHKYCMGLKTKEEMSMFECHRCILQNFDPFHKVKTEYKIIPPILINNGV